MADYVDEWVWRARVEDETQSFFERFESFAEDYRNKANSAFGASTEGAEKSAAAIGVLSSAVAGLTVKVLDFALQAGKTFVNFAKDSVLLAARVETLGVSLNQVGKQAGYTEAEIASAEESVKSMGITTQSARQSLLLMTRANIDWSEASNLARVAQDAAVIAGLNSSQAFERLVRGIQKQEPELLDELGITLRRTEAYDKFASTIGKTVKQLTVAEQRQAILNEIYAQAGVVAGSYEAAMGTAGKQAASLARHVEELQLAIGEAFQPIYQQYIAFMTDALKQLRDFVEDNNEALTEFGELLGDNLQKGLTVLLKLLELTLKLASAQERLRVKTKEFVTELAGEESISKFEKWKQSVVTSGAQVISIIGGVVKAVLTGISEVASLAGDYVQAVKTTLTEGVVAGGKAFGEVANFDRLKSVVDNVQQAFKEGTQATAEFLGIVESTSSSTKKTSASIDGMSDSLVDLVKDEEKAAEETKKVKDAVDNLAKAQEALNQIRQRYDRSEADRLRQEQRQLIEDQIRLSEQRADIERNYQAKLAQIQENAEKQRQSLDQGYSKSVIEAARQHSENRLQEEMDYQDRLQQIRRDFLYNSEELARARDAIGLVRLIRENKRKLDEEQISHKKRQEEIDNDYTKRLEDLQRNYEEQKALLEQNIQEQLEAAARGREEDYRNLEENLEKERRLRELHDRWAAQDRQIALQRQLQDFIDHYSQLEGVTTAALNRMLGSWQRYAQGVTSAASGAGRGFTDVLREQYDAMNGGGSGNGNRPGFNSSGFSTSGVQDILRKYYEQQQLIGQGGQISNLLAGNNTQPQLIQPSGAGVVAPTTPRSSVDRRELYVRLDAPDLEPYMQEVAVNTLYEIERNRG